ncbi:unnamed protein product [Gongylonema pulchrum]|uniref:MMS19 nucleotide excision repair protein n=1 Tax=Gongylonema pulchrum TaxID=637853 RepID=A0A183ECY2_9BILA|nr:unnamed protein product [Gongylonema pulchrum]
MFIHMCLHALGMPVRGDGIASLNKWRAYRLPSAQMKSLTELLVDSNVKGESRHVEVQQLIDILSKFAPEAQENPLKECVTSAAEVVSDAGGVRYTIPDRALVWRFLILGAIGGSYERDFISIGRLSTRVVSALCSIIERG